MPELPDVTVYVESLERHVVGSILEAIRLKSPFLLRSVDPPPSAAHGRQVVGVRSIGKRIVLALAEELFVVIHLMVAGRLYLKARGAAIPGKVGVAAFDFSDATILFCEASGKKRASLHMVRGEGALRAFDRGGLDVFATTPDDFALMLRAENHTLKRSLTDPRLVSGIGNTYADEILHRSRLSPVALSHKLSDDEINRLLQACQEVLSEWTDRLRAEVGAGFPDKATAFREGMAVHGRFGQSCPVCGATVQRIRYAASETNYCPPCQTGGRLLADRALSRLLKKDWPRTLEELEELKQRIR